MGTAQRARDDVDRANLEEQRRDLSTLTNLRQSSGDYNLTFINGLEKRIEREINRTTRYFVLLKYLRFCCQLLFLLLRKT